MDDLATTRIEPVSDRNEQSPFGGIRRNRRKPVPPPPVDGSKDEPPAEQDEPKPELDEIA